MPTFTEILNTFVFSVFCCVELPVALCLLLRNANCVSQKFRNETIRERYLSCVLLQGSSVCMAPGKPHLVTFSLRRVPNAQSCLALLPAVFQKCLSREHPILYYGRTALQAFGAAFLLMYVLMEFPCSHLIAYSFDTCSAVNLAVSCCSVDALQLSLTQIGRIS